jgi:hypothetical protein
LLILTLKDTPYGLHWQLAVYSTEMFMTFQKKGRYSWGADKALAADVGVAMLRVKGVAMLRVKGATDLQNLLLGRVVRPAMLCSAGPGTAMD